ncbi:MAG: PilZ domain-containing protein [Myxococcota bacterium]
MAGKITNRRNLRILCGGAAKAEGPKGPLRGICRNISLGGLFFTGPALPVGSSVQLELQLPGSGAVSALGEVRYHHAYADGAGMGIRFLRLGQDDLARLTTFVESSAL